jgi:methyl-accepting chemotaxis protein
VAAQTVQAGQNGYAGSRGSLVPSGPLRPAAQPEPGRAGRRVSSTSSTRRSIRFKLYAAFGAVLLLMVLLGAVSLWSMGEQNTLANTSFEKHQLPVRQLAQVRADLGIIDSQVLRALSDADARAPGTYSTTAERLATNVDSALSSFQATLHTEAERRNPAAVAADWRLYQDAFRAFFRSTSAGDVAGAKRQYFDQLAPLYARIDDALSKQIDNEIEDARQTDTAIEQTFRRGQVVVAVTLLAALLLSGVLGSVLARGIARAASQVADASRGLADGDLNQRLDVRSSDELGDMADAFQTMAVRLRELIGELQAGVQDLSASSAEILAATAEQSAGAAEQSAAITETTATVNQVQVSAEQAVQTATNVMQTAQHATQVSAEGVAAVQHAMEGIADIRQKVQSIADDILTLSEQGQQIGEIISAVSDLADQSNLLALNAAIEASRAGEHGKGFTVVAQEIRALAEQSKSATVQVRTILSDIQRATNAAVLATEQGIKGVDAGAQLVEQTGRTIAELADVIQQTAQSSAQITASVRQHSAGMDQIAAAMANINQATSQNLAATQNTREAAENLTGLAQRIDAMVALYRL